MKKDTSEFKQRFQTYKKEGIKAVYDCGKVLPKYDMGDPPNIQRWVDELWKNEGVDPSSYRNGKFYPHKSAEGGAYTLDPGIKLGAKTGLTYEDVKDGLTKEQINQKIQKGSIK